MALKSLSELIALTGERKKRFFFFVQVLRVYATLRVMRDPASYDSPSERSCCIPHAGSGTVRTHTASSSGRAGRLARFAFYEG